MQSQIKLVQLRSALILLVFSLLPLQSYAVISSTITIRYNKRAPGKATIYITNNPISTKLAKYIQPIMSKTLPVVNGICKFTVPNKAYDLQYFSIIGDNNDNDERINNIMLTSGDNVSIEVDDIIVKLVGRGSEKNEALRVIKQIVVDSSFENTSIFESRVLNTKLSQNIRLKTLSTYKNKFKSYVYEAIKSDIQYKTLYDLSYNYSFYLAVAPDLRNEVIRCYEKYGLPIDSGKGQLELINSKYLLDYLIQREFVEINILSKAKGEYLGAKKDYLPLVYQQLKHKYRNSLSEKLVVQLLSKRYRSFKTDSLFTDALTYIKSPDILRIITKMKQQFGEGVSAYNFKLKDTSGRYVTLSSLKGKVLVIDFWIEHCGPCIKLAKDLRNLSKSFQGRSDILFVSIAAERESAVWKKVIQEGTHTFDGQLLLYTNGLGAKHPLISHYGYNGFPQILLINKKGNIISSRPERPSDPQKTDTFIELLNQHL